MTLDDTADRLYALAPEDFTAARDAAAKHAKSDGDTGLSKQVKALRKPSVGAWLLNLLATQDADLLEQLLHIGPALAHAQTQGQGDALRELGAQRRELVDAVTSRAVELGARPVTAAVRDEVSWTLEAALADPASADVVRSGRLVRALSYAGFGGVDLDGAVGGPARVAKPVDERPADGIAQAEVARLQQALADAEAAAHQADQQRMAAQKQSEKAVDAVRTAQRAEEQARAELDRLRRA